MIIAIGLGNPGPTFAHHRHNVGFMVLDEFAAIHALHFKDKSVFHAAVCEHEGMILAKPMTWMNDSGVAARALFKQFCATEGSLVVVYDDIDIDLGLVKCSYDRGAGGHNGLQSVIDYMGTRSFFRVRVGVRPVHEELKPRIAPPDGFEKFLLTDFAPFEAERRKDGIDKAVAILTELRTKPFEEVMNLYN